MNDNNNNNNDNTIIVSRHEATIQWLQSHDEYKYTEVIRGNATKEMVEGKIVIGNLPMQLAERTASVGCVEFDKFPPRGIELSGEDLNEYGVKLVFYNIIKS